MYNKVSFVVVIFFVLFLVYRYIYINFRMCDFYIFY